MIEILIGISIVGLIYFVRKDEKQEYITREDKGIDFVAGKPILKDL